jgi:hypothetical protein
LIFFRRFNFFSVEAEQSVKAAILIFIGMTFPSLGIYLLQAPSMALGLLFALLIYIFLCILSYNFILLFKFTLKILAILVPFIIIHGLINILFFTNFDFDKYLKSIFYLAIFISGAVSFVLLADKFPKNLTLVFKALFYLFSLFSVLSIFGFILPNYDPKSVIFYREPSHFALDFLPLVLTATIMADFKKKLLYLCIAFSIGLLLPNLTLIIGVIFIALLILDVKRASFCLLIFLVLFIASQNNPIVPRAIFSQHKIYQEEKSINTFEYILKRLPIENSDKEKNLSLLAMQSGYERAYLSVLDTYGLGVGFQQFGHSKKMGPSMFEIINILGIPLCLHDGCLVGAKFVGEIGIVGAVLILLYIIFAIKYAISLRKFSLKRDGFFSSMYIFYSSCFVLFSIDIFLRGTGYFSSSSFFFAVSLIALFIFYRGGIAIRTIRN